MYMFSLTIDGPSTTKPSTCRTLRHTNAKSVNQIPDHFEEECVQLRNFTEKLMIAHPEIPSFRHAGGHRAVGENVVLATNMELGNSTLALDRNMNLMADNTDMLWCYIVSSRTVRILYT